MKLEEQGFGMVTEAMQQDGQTHLLRLKVREGEVTPENYQRALGVFCQDIVTEIIHMEVLGDADEALTAPLIEQHGFRANLRPLDNLQ
jgi:hypothetical protein